MRTTAKKDGGDYILNGSKDVDHLGEAIKAYLVMARTGENSISAFVVREGTPGFEYGKKRKKMG